MMKMIMTKVVIIMRKFFKKIYKIIDVCIITPIGRVVYNIQKKFKRSKGSLDKFLNKKNTLILISLIFAVGLFLLTSTKKITLSESQAVTLPITLKYNEEAYVVEGVPDSVDLILTGRKSDIYLAKQLGEYEVTLDLTNYTASDSAYKVHFSYSKPISNLSYKVDPGYVFVTIKDKVSKVVSLSYNLLNVDSLDSKLSIKNVSLNKTEVVVKGSQEALDKIALVQALIDLSKENFTASGTYDITTAQLVAYDNNGKILDNIEIVPSSVSASIALESYSNSVPLKIQTTGNLIAGKSIASISINNSTNYSLSIYGEKENIDSITSVPVTIDVNGLGKESSKTYNVTLTKPSGVRYMSAKSVTIVVTFGNEEQKTVDIGNKISQKNLASGLTANIISDNSISVQVKGVASVINSVDTSNINAYVDLNGLSAGEHEVEVKIDNDNPLITYIVSSKIRINIQ